MNKLDTLISYVAPQYGAKRAEARFQMNAYGAYEGSNQNPRTRNPRGRSRGYGTTSGEHKALPIGDRTKLIQEIEDLARNDGGLIWTMMDRIADHVVGDGIFPQARTTDPVWNELAERYYTRFWSPTSDFESRQNFPFIGSGQRILINEAFMRGESFIKLLTDAQIQWYESELCRTPANKSDNEQVQDGIQLTAAGSVQAYYFVLPQADFSAEERVDRVTRNNLIHGVPKYFRSRQRRGIPVLAPIVPRMQQFAETTDAMQVKVMLESMQALKVTGDGSGGRTLQDMPFQATQEDADERKYDEIKSQSGMIYDLNEGRDIQSIETRTPSGEHMQYMDQHLSILAASVGMPKDIMLMIAGGSYSAHRGLLLEFERTRMKYWNYVSGISQRTWNWAVAKAVKDGKLPPAPVDQNGRSQWDRVEWTKPQRLSMSPKEDEIVRDSQLARGNYTITDFMRQDNREREDVWDVSQAEMIDAADRAKAMNEANPEAGFTWRDFVNKTKAGAATTPPAPAKGGSDE